LWKLLRISYIGLKYDKGLPKKPMSMKRLVIPLTLCLFAGAACWPFDGEEALAAMSLRKEGGGKVQILRQGEQPIDVSDADVPVEEGDIVRTFDGARAQVALEGDRVAWVGGTTPVTKGAPEAQMQIIDTTSVETQTGTVMAEATDPMRIRFGDAVANARNSVFRVDRRAGSARVGAYTGKVHVTAPGEANVDLTRLHEAPAAASDLRPAQPYSLDPADPFDAERLASVIELEAKLGQLSAGFASQLGRQKPDLAYFKALAGGKDVSAVKPYLRRPAIDLLLGVTIALNTKAHPFDEALREAFSSRDDGGSWGVVAAILQSDPKLLLADLGDIIDASRVVAGGANDQAVFSVAAAQAAESGQVADPVVQSNQTGNNPPPTSGNPGDEDDPQPEEPDQPPEDCSGTADCAREDLEKRIFPSPEPTPSNEAILDGTFGGDL
jgi:hypothetical protein